MAKESGIGAAVTVDDSGGNAQTITNDVTNFTADTPRELQDVTGVDVASRERIALLGDGAITLNGVFNDATNMSHAVLKNVATNTALRTIAIAHSSQTLTQESLFTGYSLTRAANGALTWSAPAQLAATTSFGWS